MVRNVTAFDRCLFNRCNDVVHCYDDLMLQRKSHRLTALDSVAGVKAQEAFIDNGKRNW